VPAHLDLQDRQVRRRLGDRERVVSRPVVGDDHGFEIDTGRRQRTKALAQHARAVVGHDDDGYARRPHVVMRLGVGHGRPRTRSMARAARLRMRVAIGAGPSSVRASHAASRSWWMLFRGCSQESRRAGPPSLVYTRETLAWRNRRSTCLSYEPNGIATFAI